MSKKKSDSPALDLQRLSFDQRPSLEDMIYLSLFTPGRLEKHKYPDGTVRPAIQWGVPLLVNGDPGTGKTARMEQIFARMRYEDKEVPSKVIKASSSGPAFLSAVPAICEVEVAPGVFKKFMDAPGHISLENMAKELPDRRFLLAIDELTTLEPDEQRSALGVFDPNERNLGSFVLPPGCRVIAGCNPATQAANGNELSLPVANRFFHYDMGNKPDVMSWCNYMAKSGLEPDTDPGVPMKEVEAAILDVFPAYFAKRSGQITTWMLERDKENKCPLLETPEDSTGATTRAYPSPRTWTLLTRTLAAYDSLRFVTERHKEFGIPVPHNNMLQFILVGWLGADAPWLGELQTYLTSPAMPEASRLLLERQYVDGWNFSADEKLIHMATMASIWNLLSNDAWVTKICGTADHAKLATIPAAQEILHNFDILAGKLRNVGSTDMVATPQLTGQKNIKQGLPLLAMSGGLGRRNTTGGVKQSALDQRALLVDGAANYKKGNN